jgi:phage-related protein
MSDGKIIYDVDVNDEGVEGKVKQTNSKIESAAQTGSGAFSEVWTGALRAIGGKLVELGQQAVSAAADVAKESLAQVASFEQNVGGVEKLFGDSASTVLANAKNAFSTAGLSANEYMENVTGFSASLISSLGGDTKTAANMADVAIRAMSDNANTFGTDMGAIMTTFQGFAKQNYSMLDNLKLGYGGTKTEMERLMRDAEKMEGYIEGSLSIESFADVVEAIQIVQENMNIAGTTAREAAGTIEGSVASMKSAWTNFLTGTMSGEEFAQTAIVAADNVVNAMMDIIPRLVSGFASMAPTLFDKAVEIVTTLVSRIGEHKLEFLQKGTEFIQNIGEGLAQGIPDFLGKALPMIEQFTANLRVGAGKFIDSGIDFILNLMQGLMNSLPTLIAYIPTIISNVVNIINDNMPKILAMGVKLIFMLIEGIVKSVPALIENFPKIIKMILDVWQAINWGNIGRFVINGIKNGVSALATNIPQLMRNIGNNAKNLFSNINWRSLGTNLINLIANGIRNLFSSIPNALSSIGRSALNAFRSINWYQLGAGVISGIVNGLWNGMSSVIDAAREVASRALSAAKSFLGIHSPSTEFAKVGRDSDEGQAEGMIENADVVEEASQEVARKAMDAQMSVDYSLPDIDSASRDMSASITGSFAQSVSRIIEVPLNIDAREIARATAWDMGEQLAWEAR